MGLILLIVLLVGVMARRGHSRGWGSKPSGGGRRPGLILGILLLLGYPACGV